MSCQAILENPRDGEPYIIWYNRNIPLEFKDGELVGIDTFWHELWDNGIEPPLPELDEHEREAYAAGVIKGREFLLKRLQALLPDIPRGYKTTLYFGREYRTEHSMFKEVTERDIMFRFGVEGIWEIRFCRIHTLSEDAFNKPDKKPIVQPQRLKPDTITTEGLLEKDSDGHPHVIWGDKKIPLEYEDGKLIGIDALWKEMWDGSLAWKLPYLNMAETYEYCRGLLETKDTVLKLFQERFGKMKRVNETVGFSTFSWWGSHCYPENDEISLVEIHKMLNFEYDWLRDIVFFFSWGDSKKLLGKRIYQVPERYVKNPLAKRGMKTTTTDNPSH